MNDNQNIILWKQYVKTVILFHNLGGDISLFAISKGKLQISTIEQWNLINNFLDSIDVSK